MRFNKKPIAAVIALASISIANSALAQEDEAQVETVTIETRDGEAVTVEREVDIEIEGSQKAVEEIYVTGSKIKMKDNAITTAPIQMISRVDIENSGAGTVSELLAKITANNGASMIETETNFIAGAQSVSLRGLGVSRNLVLVNGRRVAAYSFGQGITDSFVDVNQLSLDAIERVEVYLAGASATYGSDAMTGVLNFILRKDYEGTQISGMAYVPEQGGGEEQSLNVMWGKSFDKGNIMANVNFFKNSEAFNTDRDFLQPNSWLDVYGNLDPGYATNGIIDSYGNITEDKANFDQRSFLNWTFGDPALEALAYPRLKRNDPSARYILYNHLDSCAEEDKFESYSTNSLYCGSQEQFILTPERERFNLTLNGVYDFGFADGYMDAQFNRGTTTYNNKAYPLRTLNLAGLVNFNDGALGQPTYAYATDLLGGDFAGGMGLPGAADFNIATAAWRMDDLGQQIQEVTTTDFRIAAGLTGIVFNDWDYDANVIYARNHVNDKNYNFAKESALIDAVQNYEYFYMAGIDLTPYGINVTETNSEDTLARIRTNTEQKGTSQLASIGFTLSRNDIDIPTGELAVAISGEMRYESIENIPDEQLLNGEIYNFGSISPLDADREIYALSGEAIVPLGFDLTATLAGRFEEYSDFGSNFSPTVGLKWDPTDWVMLRANYSEGFRAPSLQELYLDGSTGYYSVIDYVRCEEWSVHNDAVYGGTDPYGFEDVYCGYDSHLTYFNSNPDLGPEESNNTTVGLVVRPTETTSISVDYWKVEIEDLITVKHPLLMLYETVYEGATQYDSNFTRNGLNWYDTSYFGVTTEMIETINTSYFNLGTKGAEGVDLQADILLETNVGNFVASASATKLLESYEDTELGYSNYEGRNGYPELTAQLYLGWSNDDWSAGLQGFYRDKMKDVYADPYTADGSEIEIGSAHSWNLSTSYTGFEDFQISLQVINLFEHKPMFTTDPTWGLNRYPVGGVDGRAYRVSFKWDL